MLEESSVEDTSLSILLTSFNSTCLCTARYRHEVVWDDERFYTIGGCTLQEDFSFDLVSMP